MSEQITYRGRVRMDATPVVVVVAIRNPHTSPELLTATRLSGLDKGDETFPGGRKKRNETIARTGVREWQEEVGQEVRGSRFIGVHDRPVTVETRAGLRPLYIVFAHYDEKFVKAGDIQHRETGKNTRWKWRSLREVENLVREGKMHPAVLERLWQREGDILPNFVHGMHIDEYDFPFGGLHAPEILRDGTRPYRYLRSKHFPL